jgi:hypothetical protein
VSKPARIARTLAPIAFIFLFSFPLTGAAATVTVPGDHPTVQQAIDAAQPGNVIEVAAGAYQESLRVTKALTLRAVDATGVVFTAAPEAVAVLEVAEDITVHLEDLSFQGGRMGVQLNTGAKAAIRRCTITGQSEAGIAAQEDVELAIWDNEIASVKGAGIRIAATARVIGGGNRIHDNGTDIDGWIPRGARLGQKPAVTLRTDPDKGLFVTLKLTTLESEVRALINTVNLPKSVPPDMYDVSIQSRGAKPDIPWGTIDVVGEEIVHVNSGITLHRLLPVPWRVLDAQTGDVITTVSHTRTVPLPPGHYRLVVPASAQDISLGPPDGIVVPEGRVIRVPADYVTQPVAPVSIDVDDPEVAALLAQARASQHSCPGPVEAGGQLRLGNDPLAVDPNGNAAAWLWRFNDQGRSVRVVAAVQPDGAFRFERVTPGVYFLESQYRDAEGRYYEGASQTVDVGCDGAAGLSQLLEGTDVVLPKLPEEPHALLRLKFPAFMPEAYAAESARLGGCEADPDEPPCACGKLRVCVFSGDNRLPASGGMLPVPVKGEIGRWTWLGRDMPPKIPYKFEQDFANALGQASPCYDIVPMDATWSKIAWHGQEFRRIFEQLKAARAAGDTALAEQLTAAAKQLLQTNFVRALQALGHGTCPAVVVLGSSGGTVPKITASVQVDGEVALEGSASTAWSWARRLAKQVDGQLAPMQQKLFGSCQETVRSCTGVDWELAHQTHRCDYTQYCNDELMRTWTEHGEYLRAVGRSTERERVCCSESAQEATGNAEGNALHCPGTSGLMTEDLDCDGLLNSDDPTPLPAEAVEELNRKIEELTGGSP